MAYIIENVNRLINGQLDRTSLMIEQNKVAYIKSSLEKYRFMRMNAESYIMTPTYAIFDTQIPVDESFQRQKDYYSSHFIMKGCTILLTYVSIDYEYELGNKLMLGEKGLLNSPIDYLLGVKIPIRLLTPSFMRKCKQKGIPAVFVDIKNKEELETLPWGWIREAMFPLNSPLIPIFPREYNRKELKQVKALWQKVTKKEKLPSLEDEIPHQFPIKEVELAKIKLYPVKASIQQGREVSYNLYEYSSISRLDGSTLFEPAEEKLLVTVHKGKVIRAGKQVFFQPGCGENINIKLQS
ncbi:hypothetical protein [Bacillus tuaregi]|uniref:hypothetical protein n=1 Tax=Bacillus tuaregi TaxID=1816695 RepID=UPI0008F8D761|nr:hypothetical protein [Bacillus tuaregi]